MKKIEYTITFHTDWHCGSGLSASADVDSLPIKDASGLPYVPGKTMKGLVREAIEDFFLFSNNSLVGHDEKIKKTFGFFDDKDKTIRGSVFFSNALLPKSEASEIKRCHMEKYLFRTLSNTAIDKTGIAAPHSLRKIDVTVPCKLHGYISGIPEELEEEIKKALCYIKRIGQGRNRGLGRCTITPN